MKLNTYTLKAFSGKENGFYEYKLSSFYIKETNLILI